jgi:uncharacterized protein (DUF58 family)
VAQDASRLTPEKAEIMKAMRENPAGVGAPGMPMPLVADSEPTAAAKWRTPQSHQKSEQRIVFQSSGMLFSPDAALIWLFGSLGVATCIAPWVAHGWPLLDLIAAAVGLVACYDVFALWLARNEFVPVLLPQEKDLRGREGQSLPIPLALAGSDRSRTPDEVRVAIMPATRESEMALWMKSDPQRLKLGRPEPAEGRSISAGAEPVQLWPWTPEIALLRRGLWPGPRVGIERRSRFGIWRLRRWFDLPVPLRIDADLRSGRRQILSSPIYRALVAARETPWTGNGRDFERLREYQRGDNFSEIAWKSTARRGTPVTRLFQWEQKQEVYFVVDQSRTSALAIDPAWESEANVQRPRAPRRLLDLAVETALVGATVALELGDDFGLVTYAEEPKFWLRAGSGQFQFHRFRDRLLNLEPLPTTADYEALFSQMRMRLRRRAYLVLLADLAERSISDSLGRGIALLRSSHVILMTSVLPAHARPAFSSGEEPRTDQDVYAALAGEKENQRLAALARQLRQTGVELRFVSPKNFLRTAVEGYLQSKREQRV